MEEKAFVIVENSASSQLLKNFAFRCRSSVGDIAVAIPFNCPKCGQKLTLTTSKPGDWLDCPNCEAAIQVPGGPPAKPKPVLAAAPRSAPTTRSSFTNATTTHEPENITNNRRVQIIAVGGGLLALLLLAGVAVIALDKPKPPLAQTQNNPPSEQPPAGPTPPPSPTPLEKPKDNPPPPPEPDKPELADVELTQTKPRTLRLGVNGKNYDDVGAILKSLGRGYAFTELRPIDLEDADVLKQFDVIFLNCGGAIGRPNLTIKALREFVAAGKSLYASDLQFDLIRNTFPDVEDPMLRADGTRGDYEAEVLDQGLQALLGKTVNLTFNLDGWKAAAFSGESVTPILRATDNGRLKAGTPLLVRFRHGQGTVFFTSFHNSVIASDTAKNLLRYLVFSAVIADAEGRVLKVLKRADFTVRPPELLTAPDETWTATRKIALKKDGLFRLGVGFNNEGAEVKLVIEGPSGVKYEKVGKDAFIVEMRNATVGEWKITLSANKLPYPNFPFTLILAELK